MTTDYLVQLLDKPFQFLLDNHYYNLAINLDLVRKELQTMTTQHDLHGYRNGVGPCICAACEDARKVPHPDTARADEAERMLREAIKLASSYAPGEPVAMCLIRDVHGLREWYDARSKRYSESLKRNALEAKIREQRAALAATEAELAKLTEDK